MLKETSIRLEQNLLEKVDKKAKEKDVSRTVFLREIIEDFFDNKVIENLLYKQSIYLKIIDTNSNLNALKLEEKLEKLRLDLTDENDKNRDKIKREIDEIKMLKDELNFDLKNLKEEI